MLPVVSTEIFPVVDIAKIILDILTCIAGMRFFLKADFDQKFRIFGGAIGLFPRRTNQSLRNSLTPHLFA
jgi:hypothetical protein